MMNEIIKRCFKKYGIKCLMLFCLLPLSANATLISIESSTSQVTQSEIIELELWARNLNGELISGFAFDINFDDTSVAFESSSFGSGLGKNIFSFQDTINFGNVINIAESSFQSDSDLFSQQMGNDFLLASLRFSALNVNTVNFSVVSSDVIGANYTQLSTITSSPLRIDIVAQQVPEPSTLVLLFFALIMSVVVHRKMNKTMGNSL